MIGITQVTADTNDIWSDHEYFQSVGKGVFRIWAAAAAAADGTITINDGKANIVDGSPITVRAAAVTYPEVKKNEDSYWEFTSSAQDRPRVNVTDGTNAEIVVQIQLVKRL